MEIYSAFYSVKAMESGGFPSGVTGDYSSLLWNFLKLYFELIQFWCEEKIEQMRFGT